MARNLGLRAGVSNRIEERPDPYPSLGLGIDRESVADSGKERCIENRNRPSDTSDDLLGLVDGALLPYEEQGRHRNSRQLRVGEDGWGRESEGVVHEAMERHP